MLSLNLGCGGGSYIFNDLKCDVNCDIEKPKVKIKSFVCCDACFLPFVSNIFEKVYAYNLLEHVKDYRKVIDELIRVCNGIVMIRFDKIYNLANWWTLDHEYIQHGKHLIAVPRIIKLLRFVFRYPTIHNRIFRYVFSNSFVPLRKMGLLDRWNYYCVRKCC